MSIPDHVYAQFPNLGCVGDVQRYLEEGKLIDEYLEAFVSSDLKLLGVHFDSINWAMIFEWTKWFHEHAPSSAWGSYDNVNEWCKLGGLKGLERKLNG